jgi:uncharacterized lipoprotein
MARLRLANIAKLLLLATFGLQASCSWVNRSIAYEDARETPPLKVPAGMINPPPNPALVVPRIDGMATNVDTAPPTLGNTVAVARSGLPRAANAVLPLADEAASTWRRVGIALERSDCCRVLSKDQAAMTYEVELTTTGLKPGFFKRMFGASAAPSVMTVLVAAADAGATVTVVDAAGALRRDDSAMTVLGVVEARLR